MDQAGTSVFVNRAGRGQGEAQGKTREDKWELGQGLWV